MEENKTECCMCENIFFAKADEKVCPSCWEDLQEAQKFEYGYINPEEAEF